MRVRHLSWVFACLAGLAGCALSEGPVSDWAFACAEDRDCVPGYFCVAGTCSKEPWVQGPIVLDAGPTLPDAGHEPVCRPRSRMELDCADGRDDDCDGEVDCADEDCAGKGCGTGAHIICCGRTCTDVSQNPQHCGACGLSCKGGQACRAVETPGGMTGQCGCSADPHCPRSGTAGLTAHQVCQANRCVCTSANACPTGMSCGDAGVCLR